jgi:hypothetical protein
MRCDEANLGAAKICFAPITSSENFQKGGEADDRVESSSTSQALCFLLSKILTAL